MEVWFDCGDEEAKASAAGGGVTRRRHGGLRAPSHPSSSSSLGPGALRREVPSAFLDNKENVDPRFRTLGRSAPRSPIPSWYPRLPLQDITLLLNAYQGMQVDDEKMKSKFESCSFNAASGPEMVLSVGGCRAQAARMSMTNGCKPLLTTTSLNKAQNAAALRKHYR